MKKAALLSFLIFTSPLSAVLPPVWQGIAEIKAIANAPDLKDYLDSGEILEGITKTDTGWLIQTSQSQVTVEVIPLPQEMPGPMKFTLKFKKI